ncbi:MAG TPA: Hsp20/alpha crystallin family protein, partial [Streptosporangiaceae bacterium]
MSTTRQRPGRRGTTAPGAPVVVLLGGHAAARGTCRVEAPGRVLRMWSMLNPANEELHQGRCRRRLCRACSDCWTLCGRITVDGGTLTIRAERREEENEAHRSEFRYGSFTRSVALPDRA